MYADEADQDGSKEFLVYAAVFFPAENVKFLCDKVTTLRKEFGFSEGDNLKFSTGTKPATVSRDDHTNIKNAILELAAEQQCKVCCYVVPHSIAKGQTNENRLKFGINTLLTKFDQFLRENGGVGGTVHFDRTTDFNQESYFKEIINCGISWHGNRKPLLNIVSIDSTQNGMSHLCSITDIVVGAFRWVINEPDKDKVAKALWRPLSKAIWGKTENGTKFVREYGLLVRPQNVKATTYQADIESFIQRLQEYSEE